MNRNRLWNGTGNGLVDKDVREAILSTFKILLKKVEEIMSMLGLDMECIKYSKF